MTYLNFMEYLMAVIGTFCLLSGAVTLLFLPEQKSALRTRGQRRAAVWFVLATLAIIANTTYHFGPMSPTAFLHSVRNVGMVIVFCALLLGASAAAGFLLIKWSGFITKDLRAASDELTPSTK